jgi:hypothetical protein
LLVSGVSVLSLALQAVKARTMTSAIATQRMVRNFFIAYPPYILQCTGIAGNRIRVRYKTRGARSEKVSTESKLNP